MLEVKSLVKEYHNHLIFDHFNLKICGPNAVRDYW